MPRSGIKISDDIFPMFNELKMDKKFLYIVLKVSKDKKLIEVEKTKPATHQLTSVECLDEIKAALPEDECRWAFVDFPYEQEKIQKNKPFFVKWNPDGAKISDKMMLASSSKDIFDKLEGALSIDVCDQTDFDAKAFIAKANRNY